MRYKDLRSKMKTGDVISFNGKGWFSWLIKWKTRSDISHVGIVYRTKGDRVIIMESTSLNNIADCKTGEFIKGVQQQYLSDRIDTYKGKIYWRPLNVEIKKTKQNKMSSWLKDKHGKHTPYDTLQALGSGADILLPENDEDFKKLFCSELVCKALQLADVVGEELNASEQTPADVIKYGCLEERIQIS